MLIIYVNEFKKFGTETDLKRFLAILEYKKIKYRLVTEQQKANNKIEIEHENLNTLKSKLLTQDSSCRLFWKYSSKIPGYFLLVPTNKKESHLFLSNFLSLIEIVKKMGYLQYTFVQYQGSKRIKLIPVAGVLDEVDINAKIINTIRCFFDENKISRFNLLPSYREYMKQRQDKSSESLTYPKVNFWTQVDKLDRNITKSTFDFLIENNIIAHPESFELKLKQENDKSEIKAIKMKKIKREVSLCAFCVPDIIKKQLILDLKDFLILVNYRPYSGTRVHLLIVPSHIEDWSNLNLEQYINLEKIVRAITQSIKINEKITENNLFSLVQNGVGAGQTVPGSHLHIMNTPNYLSYLLDIGFQMIGKETPTLSKDEMSAISYKLKPEIVQSLLSECSPNQFSVTHIWDKQYTAYFQSMSNRVKSKQNQDVKYDTQIQKEFKLSSNSSI